MWTVSLHWVCLEILRSCANTYNTNLIFSTGDHVTSPFICTLCKCFTGSMSDMLMNVVLIYYDLVRTR